MNHSSLSDNAPANMGFRGCGKLLWRHFCSRSYIGVHYKASRCFSILVCVWTHQVQGKDIFGQGYIFERLFWAN